MSTRQWYADGRLTSQHRVPVDRIRHELGRAMDDLDYPTEPASLRPVVLTEQAYDAIFQAGSRLLRLLRRTLMERADTPAGRIAALGADPDEYPLCIEGPLEDRFATCMSRPDVVIDADGPKFVEFNVGGGVGRVVDTTLATSAWVTAFGGRDAAPFTTPDAMAVRDAFFLRTARELGVRPAVALVGTARDVRATTTRHFDLQVDSMRRSGLEAEFFEPEGLFQALHGNGELSYPLGLRYFTVPEWRRLGIDLAEIRAALDAGCLLLATQTAYMIANKKVMGWLSEGRPWMTADDRALVERYLPWTRVVTDRKVEWRGRQWSLPALLLGERERFVLKLGTGIKGEEVLIGRFCERAEWEAKVAEAVAGGDHIAQEFVETIPCRMEFADDSGPGSYEADVYPVFGPYIFDGRAGGLGVRYLPGGRQGIISVQKYGALPSVAVRGRSA
ncbi:hypothetical protein ABT187_03110 [Streptomyces sp. NPDC001817]|uniref:hypothetical protein n=1 Tax=Streptomyces sp. NPDC001817 TaxID=3154398 RepID=UPI003333B17E